MGTVVISVDASLAWAGHPGTDGSLERYREARHAWRRSTYLFDRYGIPATWLVVGHLFLHDCDGVHVGHPLGASWFPCSEWDDSDTRRVWCARDLVEGVENARTDHEIGCQPFAGTDFATPTTTQEVAAAEVRSTIEAAADAGVDDTTLRSFGFPNDRIGHRNVLAAYGLECYRGPRPGWERRGVLSSLRTLGKLLSASTRGVGPSPVQPEVDDCSLVNLPVSIPLFPLRGRSRSIAQTRPNDPIVRLVDRGLETIASESGILHLSFSPREVTSERDFERLETVVSRISERRRESGIRVETMGQVSRRLRDHTSRPPTAAR